MFSWLDFYILLFWSSIIIFLLNNKSNINLLIYSELTWIVLYTISTIVGAQLDDIISSTLTFFILGFGGLEFVVGLMLIVLLKNSNIYNTDTNNLNNLKNFNNVNIKKWNL